MVALLVDASDETSATSKRAEPETIGSRGG